MQISVSALKNKQANQPNKQQNKTKTTLPSKVDIFFSLSVNTYNINVTTVTSWKKLICCMSVKTGVSAKVTLKLLRIFPEYWSQNS